MRTVARVLQLAVVVAVAASVAVVPSARSRIAALTLKPCLVQGVRARCGTFQVPENRAQPGGRKIGLHVVVLPALLRPAAKDAVTYLEGGPGVAATSQTFALWEELAGLNLHHDILLVDQRGTGRSNAYSCPAPKAVDLSGQGQFAWTRACLRSFGGDMRQYGTRTAADDLDAVRAALGYRRLDVMGGSYGATAAQVYLRLHPSSVRTLTLFGGTELDVPFFGRWATNAQRALDQWARLCDSQPACRRAFPGWEHQFAQLVHAWDEHPVRVRAGVTMTGVGLASVVHSMLVDATKAPSIPLLVSRAATGDYRPLRKAGGGDLGFSRQIMYWSIWCNEPWAGLDARGPWGTAFDSYTTTFIATFHKGCTYMPKRAEPRALWRFPTSVHVPVLAFAGGADPQDPPANLPLLARTFPDSRIVVLPHVGHEFGVGGCVDEIAATFVARATTRGLVTTQCNARITVAPFPLRD